MFPDLEVKSLTVRDKYLRAAYLFPVKTPWAETSFWWQNEAVILRAFDLIPKEYLK